MSAADSDSDRPRDALATLRIPRDEEQRGPRARSRRKWLVALVLLAAAASGGWVLARQQGWLGGVAELLPKAIRSLPEVRVSRATVQQGRAADAVVVATGYLESRRQAKIGARAAGRIESVQVEEGTRVTAGQVLAVLEHQDMAAALAAMKATLAQAQAQLAEQEVAIERAKADYQRAQELHESRSISQADYEQAKFDHEAAVARRGSLQAAIQLAQARVEESEQLVKNMIIRAPFDGTVISKDAEVGESILPGGMGEASGRGSVVTIADLNHLEVDCDVKEDYIGRVVPGGPAQVAVDAVPDKRYQGRVRKIIPMGDRARATIKVKVEILDADSQLFPDMSATAYFLPEAEPDEAEPDGAEPDGADDQQRRVFCDAQALQRDEQGRFVWIVDEQSRAQKTAVQTGNERDGRVEITAGLQGGEQVVVSPPPDIRPGMLLNVRD